MKKVYSFCVLIFLVGCSDSISDVGKTFKEAAKGVENNTEQMAEANDYEAARQEAEAAAQEAALAAGVISSTKGTSQDVSASKWYKQVKISELDDSKNIFLTLDAENSFTNWLDNSQKPSLNLRCKEGKTEAYVNIGMPFQPEYEYGKQNLKVRYGKDKSQVVNFSESSDQEAVFFPQPIAAIKKMLTKEQLVIEVKPFNQGTEVIAFDLNGLDRALIDLRKACSW